MDTNFEVDEFYNTDEFPRSVYFCPVCAEMYPDRLSIDPGCEIIYQHRSCKCGATWTDVYEYTGFIFDGMEED